MPVAPAQPFGEAVVTRHVIDFPAVAAGSSQTSEGVVVPRTGYVTAARLLMDGAVAFNGTNFRTYALVDPTTRTAADANIVSGLAAANLGPYNAATAYTAGQFVSFNALTYVCISAVTGGTGPVADTTHWQPIVAPGLQYVNSVLAAFTPDDVGKAISDAGNTNIPASSFIGALAGYPAAAGGAVAAILSSVSPSGPSQTSQSATASVVQPGPPGGAIASQVNGVVVQQRTVTIGSSRTIGSYATSAVSLAAGVETDLVLSTTDTRVFKGDALQMTSVFTAAGVADPGGALQIEITAYGEGTG